MYYEDVGVCKPCDCLTCTGVGNEYTCTSCPEGEILFDGKCIDKCPLEPMPYYLSSGECLPCEPTC